MKKLLLLIVFLGCINGLYAQTSGGPDNYGYIWRDSNDPNGPAFNWIDIRNDPATVQITGLGDDNAVGPYLLPAPFPYYWYQVTDFKVGSNGYLSFDNATFAQPFPLIPLANNSNNFVAGMMTDLNFDNQGPAEGNPAKCYMWVSPNEDSVIVTYDSVPFWSNVFPTYDGVNTFQIIFNYNDSSITYQYLEQIGIVGGGVTANIMTIGIENVSGTDGLQHSHDLYPTVNYAIKFYAPSTTTQQITDASAQFNSNPTTSAVFLSRNLAGSYPLETQIKNEGNVTLNPFTVNVKVVNNSGLNQLNTNLTSDTLQAGQTQLIVSPNNFLPTTTGTYRFVTTTNATGDLVASNNVRTLEIVVVDTTLSNIQLSYEDGTANGAGISWNGGDGACANHFIPPFYPCNISSVDAYITADPNNVGYTMLVYKDDGPNGTAGTFLDSVPMAPGNFVVGSYVNSPLNNLIQIDSMGFYVMWDMRGAGVTLGTSINLPFCNRGYEVLGGTWSPYRNSETEDLMIRANIQRVGVGLPENVLESYVGQFYPNPSGSLSRIDIDQQLMNDDQLTVQLFDLTGRALEGRILSNGNNQFTIETEQLSQGIYTVQFTTGKTTVSRKLTVAR